MTHRGIGAMALVGAAAGAVVSAALISSPMAYADPPPVPAPGPPGIEGNPTILEDSSFPYLYNFLQENIPYTIYDQSDHVIGAYDVKDTGGIVGLLPLFGVDHSSAVVTDSTGAAPAVGTEFDGTALFSVIAPGGYAQEIVGNSFMSSPDGTSSDLFGILPGDAIGNYISIGPTGLLDEVGFFGTWVPIIDIPT